VSIRALPASLDGALRVCPFMVEHGAQKSLADRREKKSRTDRSPIWLLAKKDLGVAAVCFELRPRQILDPHRACYLCYILVSVGFRFSSCPLLGKPLKQP
jgi:hypothetical protein